MSENLTLRDLRDAMQQVIRAATSLWYSTSEVVERGQAIACQTTTPPFVIVHPDDVALLGDSARHLREYRPTQAELVERARQWKS